MPYGTLGQLAAGQNPGHTAAYKKRMQQGGMERPDLGGSGPVIPDEVVPQRRRMPGPMAPRPTGTVQTFAPGPMPVPGFPRPQAPMNTDIIPRDFTPPGLPGAPGAQAGPWLGQMGGQNPYLKSAPSILRDFGWSLGQAGAVSPWQGGIERFRRRGSMY